MVLCHDISSQTDANRVYGNGEIMYLFTIMAVLGYNQKKAFTDKSNFYSSKKKKCGTFQMFLQDLFGNKRNTKSIYKSKMKLKLLDLNVIH